MKKTKDRPWHGRRSKPFVSQPGAKPETKPEIWSSGLRNPWRISFDRLNGDLFMADVGQNKLEEINMQPAGSKGGENYGWRCYEADQLYNTAGCQEPATYIAPILSYDHNEKRCSVTGGYVYRGQKFPALTGKYFYGDYCNGQLYYAAPASKDTKSWKQTLIANTLYKISTFGQDSRGELYFTDYATGSLYQLQDVAN